MGRASFACCSAIALLPLLIAACGGSTAREANGTPSDAGADGAPDAGSELCQGPSKLVHGGKTVLDVPVTASSTPVLSCCEAAVLRLHAKGALGSDFDLALRAMGAFEVGTHAVGAGEKYSITLRAPGGELWAEPNVTGSVQVSQAGGDLPTKLSLCLEVSSSGDPLQGMRVWLDGVSIAPNAWQQRFGLWLLADAGLGAADAAKLGLAALQTEPLPVLGLGDIGFYQASTHHVGWSPPLQGHQALLAKLGNVGVAGRPFVVQADGERVYLGAFVTAVSSFAVDMPAVVVQQISADGFVIDGSYPSGSTPEPDPRADPRILKVLAQAQKLVP